MKQNKKAFTLVELLVVISIIALLVSILMPALNKARETAKFAIDGANMRQVGLAMQMYGENNNQRSVPGDNASGNNIRGPSVNTGLWEPVNVGHLLASGDFPEPSSNDHPFYDPGITATMTMSVFDYRNDARPFRDFYHNWDGAGSGYTAIQYEYRDTLDGIGAGGTTKPNNGANLDKLSKYPYYSCLIGANPREAVKIHNFKVNVLFGDGSVQAIRGEAGLGLKFFDYVVYNWGTSSIDDSNYFRMIDDIFGIDRWQVPDDGSRVPLNVSGTDSDPRLNDWVLQIY